MPRIPSALTRRAERRRAEAFAARPELRATYERRLRRALYSTLPTDPYLRLRAEQSIAHQRARQ